MAGAAYCCVKPVMGNSKAGAAIAGAAYCCVKPDMGNSKAGAAYEVVRLVSGAMFGAVFIME